jgi:NCAIR mutase (PurE)-related protein
MRNRKLDSYLKDIAEGRVSPAEAAEKLRMQPYDDMDFAKLDTNREWRTGRGEVVFALGKTPEQVASIMRRMAEHAAGNMPGKHSDMVRDISGGQADSFGNMPDKRIDAEGDNRQGEAREPRPTLMSPILATKAGQEHFDAVQSAFGDGFIADNLLTLEYNATAKMIIIKDDETANAGGDPGGGGLIAVVSGGTADMPIAEEAAVTAELYGHDVMRAYDVGISGLHRLLDKIEDIRKADAVIAVAGMEGALASVVAGLVSSPVVAVPTSVGYGITLSGLTPLFAMLDGCSLGVGVMNIDNGFGAAHYASMILGVRGR